METIYKSDFCEYVFYPEDNLLIGRWFNTDHLTQDSFKEELINGELPAIKQCEPNRYLIDTSSFELPIAPDTQQWIVENVSRLYPIYGVKKLAFLTTTAFVAQLSLRQSNEESDDGEVERKHFDNEEAALNWLKSSKL
ncbi:hypothetical protein BKI52_34300 [marine bacterium AO1-C]|nr:hypothetical protein BKI52_34300 [marine bacterium AO1-C]